LSLFNFEGGDLEFVSGGTPVITRDGAWIRREDVDGNYSVDAVLPSGGSVFITSSIVMADLTEVFGLLVVGALKAAPATTDIEANVGIQISLNGGTTYLAWSGAAWADQAVGGAYNTQTVFAENCGTLNLSWNPSSPMAVRLRIRLTPTADDDTPMLARVLLYCEWARYSPLVDLHRSLHAAFSTAYQMRVFQQQKLAAASATFVLAPDYPVASSTDIQVFNTTTDPGRTTDLFVSYVPATGVVTMSGSQVINSVLETYYWGRPPVTVIRRDETAALSSIPHLVVEVSEMMENVASRKGRRLDIKAGSTLRFIRDRSDDMLFEVGVRIMHHTRRADEALAAADRIQVALSNDLRSRGTGFPINVIEQTANGLIDHSMSSFSTGVWSGRLRFPVPAVNYTQSAILDTVTVRFGDTRIVFDHELVVELS